MSLHLFSDSLHSHDRLRGGDGMSNNNNQDEQGIRAIMRVMNELTWESLQMEKMEKEKHLLLIEKMIGDLNVCLGYLEQDNAPKSLIDMIRDTIERANRVLFSSGHPGFKK